MFNVIKMEVIKNKSKLDKSNKTKTNGNIIN